MRNREGNENVAPVRDGSQNTSLLNAADKFSSILTERRVKVKQVDEEEEEEEDSPEENEEDEKENAMNKLKALLGPSKSKKKSQPKNSHPTATLRKSLSHNENENSSTDFLHVLSKMKRDLFHKLDITGKVDEDEEDDVSRIFYEGRDGQNYTIKVLEDFFDNLKSKAKQLIHHYESGPEKQKPVAQPPQKKEKEEEPTAEERESDKDRIRRKLMESKKPSAKQSATDKQNLKNLLNSSKPKKTEVNDINDVIKVDSQVLNYGIVNPGKLLGSILVITNTSDEEHTIEMSLDSKTVTYDRTEVIKNKEFEYLDELTSEEIELTEKELTEYTTEEARSNALEKKRRYIDNSENKSECWFIENPRTKDLTKKITLKLGPKCEQEFIVVLKTLQPKHKSLSLSFLNLVLPEIRDNPKYKEKRIEKEGNEDISLSEATKNSNLQVMLCGVIDPPNIQCVKQVYDVDIKRNKVPLALKPVSGTQKFRIPFKNT